MPLQDNIPSQLIDAIKYLHKDPEICIKFTDGQISEPLPTKKGVRQGCGLFPILFNIYSNKILKEWKLTVKTGTELTRSTRLNTTPYKDDHVLTDKSEDEFQIAANHLNK
jgi:hypothetical protein